MVRVEHGLCKERRKKYECMCTRGARTVLYLSFFPLDVRHQENGELDQLARA